MATASEWNPKDSVGGILGGGVLAAFGAWMLVDPNRIAQASQGQGRGATLMRLLEAIWGVPGGLVFLSLGLIIVAASVAATLKRTRSA